MIYFAIGESRPKKAKIFSRLTEWFEGVGHSHIYVTWKDALGLRWVAEAKGTGVRMLSNVEFKEHNEIVNVYRYYPVNEDSIDLIIEYAWSMMGTQYGYKQIYGLLEMRLLNKLYRGLGIKKKAINRFTDGDAAQICCEFAVRCIESGLDADLVGSDLEQWALLEMRNFNLRYGDKQPKLLIDKINGVI